MKTFRGGIHIKDYKQLTENLPIESFPIPKVVRIPIHQHFGKPADPVVKVGDNVKTGQLIASACGRFSSNIHSSISGTVKSIDTFPHPLGLQSLSIEIESDGIDEKAPELNESDPLKCIENAGIVGLGGAMFPTHIKLKPPPENKIDTVILNGAECEPYVTSDYRLMIEEPDKILRGLKIVMDILNVRNGHIGIEVNKPKAIKIIKKKISENAFLFEKYNIKLTLQALKTKYPQGGEKQLIKAVLNREVPSGKLPLDIGVVVQNTATISAIYDAVILKKPLYERIVTVAGSCVKKPGNYRVRIGTLFKDIIELTENPGKLIMGGPMMGFSQYTFDVPVIKGTNAILVFSKEEAASQKVQPCLRCGKCVINCPMGLWPGKLADLIENGQIDEAKRLGFKDCMECGLCAYNCPSLRNVVQLIKHAKQL